MSHIKRGTLVIMSHPDDESLWVGGGIISRVKRGQPVDLVCLSMGEKGESIFGGLLSPEKLALIRVLELNEACCKLGVRSCFVPGFPDDKMRLVDPNLILKYCVYIIRRIRPNEILTFGKKGITGHPDHVVLNEIMPKAIWQASLKGVYPELGRPHSCPSVKYVEIPAQKVKKLKLNLKGVKGEGLVYENVAQYLEIKKKAIGAHLSQLAGCMKLLPSKGDVLDNFLATEHFREESY